MRTFMVQTRTTNIINVHLLKVKEANEFEFEKIRG